MRAIIINHVVGNDAEAVLPGQTWKGIILYHHLRVLWIGISEAGFVFHKLQHIGQTYRGGDGRLPLVRITKGMQRNAPDMLNQIGIGACHKRC